jgi:hypothetical protein
MNIGDTVKNTETQTIGKIVVGPYSRFRFGGAASVEYVDVRVSTAKGPKLRTWRTASVVKSRKRQ